MVALRGGERKTFLKVFSRPDFSHGLGLERYTRRRQWDITNLPSSQLQQFRRLPGDKQAGSIYQ
jgi:hypothetical protein